MKTKYILIILAVLFLAGVGIGLKMFFKTHEDISKMDAVYQVEASVLIQEFSTDENAATLKYSEKPIQISGNLVSKTKLQNGTDLLILEDEMEGISCQLDSSWSAANQAKVQALEAGDQISVKGICKGYLMEVKVSPAMIVSE